MPTSLPYFVKIHSIHSLYGCIYILLVWSLKPLQNSWENMDLISHCILLPTLFRPHNPCLSLLSLTRLSPRYWSCDICVFCESFHSYPTLHSFLFENPYTLFSLGELILWSVLKSNITWVLYLLKRVYTGSSHIQRYLDPSVLNINTVGLLHVQD